MASSQAPSQSSTRAALIQRTPEDPIAQLTTGLPGLGTAPGLLTVNEFIQRVWTLAALLPEASYAINLCENRFNFLLSFCAVIAKGQTNLLPSNRGEETQQKLSTDYPGTYLLHDGSIRSSGLPSFNLSACHAEVQQQDSIPLIDLNHVAAIPFTSGSTGEPQANIKTWRTFVDSTRINAQHMLPDENLYHALATVPGQHMWGLETSILFPLLARVCIDDGKPLFPQDIAKRLQHLSEPRLLISTPVHLRSLSLSGLSFPNVERILCATAPLSQQLATDTELLLHGTLREVFGCSEVGSTACRDTATTDSWQLFDGLQMQVTDKGKAQVSAAHLPQTVELQDSIEQLANNQFRLLGRGSDMLEIAGKRGSLLEMNKVLQSHPAVIDAVVFLPEESTTKEITTNDSQVKRLVALVVLTTAAAKQELPDYLRARIDPVFIPRPIIVVDTLPREENGKLQKQKLLTLYKDLKEL